MTWISVKERLPDKGQIVLAGRSDFTADPVKYTYFENGKFYRKTDVISSMDRIMTIYYPDITHWMPLPDPPKEER